MGFVSAPRELDTSCVRSVVVAATVPSADLGRIRKNGEQWLSRCKCGVNKDSTSFCVARIIVCCEGPALTFVIAVDHSCCCYAATYSAFRSVWS